MGKGLRVLPPPPSEGVVYSSRRRALDQNCGLHSTFGVLDFPFGEVGTFRRRACNGIYILYHSVSSVPAPYGVRPGSA